jgi:hypothetical protein
MSKKEKKDREFISGMELLSEQGREYIKNMVQTMFSYQKSHVESKPPRGVKSKGKRGL